MNVETINDICRDGKIKEFLIYAFVKIRKP